MAAIGTVAAAACASPAAADRPVVSATVYAGSGDGISTQSVAQSALESCGNYAGPPSIAMQPSGTQQPIPLQQAWTLGTVVTCGLQVPQQDVTAVQVRRTTGTYETALDAAQIFEPSRYPGTDGALPTIFGDGTENQTTYVRPPTGATDQNAADEVVEQDEPVALTIYERTTPLKVGVTQAGSSSKTSSGERVTLRATVTAADGTTIDPSQLTYDWSINDSPASTAATPTLSVASGTTPVALAISDRSQGTGGTTTIEIDYSPSKTTHHGHHPHGAGSNRHGNNAGATHKPHRSDAAPTGSHSQHRSNSHSDHRHRGSGPGTADTQHQSASDQTRGTTAQTTTTETTTVTTARQTTPTTTSKSPFTVDHSPTKRPSQAHHDRRRTARAQATAGRRLVSGRLVADVQALPQRSSPLVHSTAEQAATPAVVHAPGATAMSLPSWAYGIAAVLALIGGGALYERRGRRRRSLHD